MVKETTESKTVKFMPATEILFEFGLYFWRKCGIIPGKILRKDDFNER